MATRRYSSVNAPLPATRRPWGLGGAAVALLVYGGMVVSGAGGTARTDSPVFKRHAVRPVSRPASTTAAPAVSARTVFSAAGSSRRGSASWYGRDLQGSPTASGEPFDMNELTAAHRTLPLGSYARVRNLDNGRSVVVRINDRGPHARRRMIDLSYAAAREIRMVGSGTARVEVVAVTIPTSPDRL